MPLLDAGGVDAIKSGLRDTSSTHERRKPLPIGLGNLHHKSNGPHPINSHHRCLHAPQHALYVVQHLRGQGLFIACNQSVMVGALATKPFGGLRACHQKAGPRRRRIDALHLLADVVVLQMLVQHAGHSRWSIDPKALLRSKNMTESQHPTLRIGKKTMRALAWSEPQECRCCKMIDKPHGVLPCDHKRRAVASICPGYRSAE